MLQKTLKYIADLLILDITLKILETKTYLRIRFNF